MKLKILGEVKTKKYLDMGNGMVLHVKQLWAWLFTPSKKYFPKQFLGKFEVFEKFENLLTFSKIVIYWIFVLFDICPIQYLSFFLLSSRTPLFQGVSGPGIIRRPSGGESLGSNRLNGEGVNLVADRD